MITEVLWMLTTVFFDKKLRTTMNDKQQPMVVVGMMSQNKRRRKKWDGKTRTDGGRPTDDGERRESPGLVCKFVTKNTLKNIKKDDA